MGSKGGRPSIQCGFRHVRVVVYLVGLVISLWQVCMVIYCHCIDILFMIVFVCIIIVCAFVIALFLTISMLQVVVCLDKYLQYLRTTQVSMQKSTDTALPALGCQP